MMLRRAIQILFALIPLLIIGPARASSAEDLIVSYLERYQRLPEADVQGRLDLADWCGYNGLRQQQADLLLEVLKLQPRHVGAYDKLLEADAVRTLPVDPRWAEKLENLIGPAFRLHHTQHFTILSDDDDAAVNAQAEAMEQTYHTFYHEARRIGLWPMPPAGRLVCILFRRHEDYQSYLLRYEGEKVAWTAGMYSWRTNRTAFFHDFDHPAFKQIRDQIARTQQRIARLREEMESAAGTAEKMRIQEQLKRLTAIDQDASGRLWLAARLATNAKTRHEATHQLLFNSGIQKRGQTYPFWLSEGLATVFELCNRQGDAGPSHVNQYRLEICRKIRMEPLARLLTVEPKDNDETEWVNNRYAQTWALMHFLWNRHGEELAAFLEEAQGGQIAQGGWLALFKKHFGDDLRTLDGEFQRYLDGL